MDNRSDEELVLAVADGTDDRAIGILADRIIPLVIGIAMRLGIRDPDDVAQEVLISVWRNASSWEPSSSVITWVKTIARNRCMDVLRHQASVSRLIVRVAERGTVYDAWCHDIERQETIQVVEQAIAQAPARSREVIDGVRQGVSISEQHRRDSIPQSTVSWHFRRGMESVRNSQTFVDAFG